MKASLRSITAAIILAASAFAIVTPLPAVANCTKVDPPCDKKDKKLGDEGQEQFLKQQEQVKEIKETNKATKEVLATTGQAGQAAGGYIPPPPDSSLGTPAQQALDEFLAKDHPSPGQPGYDAWSKQWSQLQTAAQSEAVSANVNPAKDFGSAGNTGISLPPAVIKDANGNLVLNPANPISQAVGPAIDAAGQWAIENPQQAQAMLGNLQNIMSGDGSALGQMAADYLAKNPAALNSIVNGVTSNPALMNSLMNSVMSGNGLSSLLANSGLASMLGNGSLNLGGLMNAFLGSGGTSQLAQMLPQMGSLLQGFMGGSNSGIASALPSLAGLATSFLGSAGGRSSPSTGLMGYSQPVYLPTSLTSSYPQLVETTKTIYFLPSGTTATSQQQAALQTIRSSTATQAAIDAYALSQSIRQTQAQTPGLLAMMNGKALGSGTTRGDVQANTVASIALHRQQLDASAILATLIEQRATELLASRASLSR